MNSENPSSLLTKSSAALESLLDQYPLDFFKYPRVEVRQVMRTNLIQQ